ncbi:MAG TPA: ATP-binding protein [Solirubrobacterales bacterium]
MPAIPRSEPFREQACPLGVCDGSGWILDAEDIAQECECRAQRMKRRRNKGVASVIPKKYRLRASFESSEVHQLQGSPGSGAIVREVRRYVDELDKNLTTGKGLWLMGDTGTGKTLLAMIVSKTALAQGHSVAIYSMPKLLSWIRQTYDSAPGQDSYLSFFERLASVDLLHIDDLGAERRNDWVLEQLYAIVNERYENERSMLLTMNVEARDVVKGMDELKEQLGPRIVSRLIEMCGDPLPLFGPDQRVEVRAVSR